MLLIWYYVGQLILSGGALTFAYDTQRIPSQWCEWRIRDTPYTLAAGRNDMVLPGWWSFPARRHNASRNGSIRYRSADLGSRQPLPSRCPSSANWTTRPGGAFRCLVNLFNLFFAVDRSDGGWVVVAKGVGLDWFFFSVQWCMFYLLFHVWLVR